MPSPPWSFETVTKLGPSRPLIPEIPNSWSGREPVSARLGLLGLRLSIFERRLHDV